MSTAVVPRVEVPKPTMIDRAIEYFAPQRAVRRLHARAVLSFASGGYDGARTDRPATREWQPRGGDADENQLPDLPMLRRRSSDLVRNAPVAAGALETTATSTVGAGLVLHARIDRDLLGLSEKEADAWERDAERFFAAWAGSHACDITRRHDFYTLQDVVFRSQLERGDVLVIRRYRERPGELLGLKLQLIEADRISNPEDRADSDRLKGGVEIDSFGAPIRYHVADKHPDSGLYRGQRQWKPVPAFGQSGEKLALHVFKPDRVGQTRGTPIFAPVIETLKQLERYTGAELSAAEISSFFTAFIKSAVEAEAGSGLAPVDADDPDPPAASNYKMGPAAVLDLAPGEDVEFANPTRPNAQFDPFFQAVLRQVGPAIGLPFELLVLHFTSSYSASRAAMLEAWRRFMTRRCWLARLFCQPSYEWAITEGVLRGIISAPGYLQDPIIRRAWLGSEWIGGAQGQIDPLKEIKAAEGRTTLGVTTLAEETAQMTGGDWERKHRQRVKEERMRRRDGLVSATASLPDEEEADSGKQEEEEDRED